MPAKFVKSQAIKLAEREIKEKTSLPDLWRLSYPKQWDEIVAAREHDVCKITSRRTGKTYGNVLTIIDNIERTVKDLTGGHYIIISKSAKHAKHLYWQLVKNLCKQRKIECKPKASENLIEIPSLQRTIFFGGAGDTETIEFLRGFAFRLIIIDECQSIKDTLFEPMIEGAADATRLDYDGKLILSGTPPLIHDCYFVNAFNNASFKSFQRDLYSNHKLFKDINFHRDREQWVKRIDKFLDKIRQRRGLKKGQEDPLFQREYLGKLIEDKESMVFPITNKNLDFVDPEYNRDWFYTIGVDMGFDDKDAIIVLGSKVGTSTISLVYEYEEKSQDSDTLARQIEAIAGKYHTQDIFVDTAGLGKKIAQTISKHHIHVRSAPKSEKLGNIREMRDMITSGKFIMDHKSLFYQEHKHIQWNKEKTDIDNRYYHSDLVPAIRYAFSMHKDKLMDAEDDTFDSALKGLDWQRV